MHRLQAIPSAHPHISSKLDQHSVEVGLCWLMVTKKLYYSLLYYKILAEHLIFVASLKILIDAWLYGEILASRKPTN